MLKHYVDLITNAEYPVELAKALGLEYVLHKSDAIEIKVGDESEIIAIQEWQHV